MSDSKRIERFNDRQALPSNFCPTEVEWMRLVCRTVERAFRGRRRMIQRNGDGFGTR